MSDSDVTTSQALSELHELLRLAALGESPQRLAATSYTNCREILLQGALRPVLPGFLLQCLTIYRFKDFIQLYSPSLQDRVVFLELAIRACETRANARASIDVLAERDA